MRKTSTPEASSENPEKLMTELDELVHFLADGPEVQQEMRLPQDEASSEEDASELDKVPVLTVTVDQQDMAGISPSSTYNLDQLVDELVDQVLPELESELRQRLKAKISESNN